MDSKRNAYFRDYTNLQVTGQNPGKHTRQQGTCSKSVSRKRRNLDNPDFVTKLRRANTADHVGIHGHEYNICDSGNVTPAAKFRHQLQPTLEDSTSDVMNVQHASAPDLEPTFEAGTSDVMNIQNASAPNLQPTFEDVTSDVMNVQQASAADLQPTFEDGTYNVMNVQHASATDLQPTFEDGTSDVMNVQQASAADLQPTFEEGTSDVMNAQHTPASKLQHQLQPACTTSAWASQIRSTMSRQEEIEICLQEILSDDGNIAEDCQDTKITIELENGPDEDYKETPETQTPSGNSKEKPECIKEKTLNRKEKPETNKELIFKHIDFLSDEDIEFTLSEASDETDSDTSNVDNRKKRKKINNTKEHKKESIKHSTKIVKKKPYLLASSSRIIEKQIETKENSTDTELITDKTGSRKKRNRINKAKERSILKKSGKEYITKTGRVIKAKSMQENPCNPENCRNKCYEISEDRRKRIFDHYWSLGADRQRDWIVSHTKRDVVKRQRTKDIESRRQFTHFYFINEGEGQKPVCLNFLLKTLDVRQRFVHLLITTSEQGSSKNDIRGRGVPANKTPPSLLKSVNDYIQELPAVPSHYCRKNSKKCYLPQEYRNLTNLYKIYKKKNMNEGNIFVGEKVFKNVFMSEFNISFHVPRKDKCVKCIKYENSPEEYLDEKEKHLKDKEETYLRFQTHQDLRKHDSNVLCTTFDLQKVLNTPYGESMLLYYSRKIATYNLTFYESITREGFCFLWNEVEGKRGANEVCTILARYIEKVDERGSIKHLLLYCDACPGQNRNKTVLACIHKYLQKCKCIATIQINYLLPGHTFMPVDSMHSVIEKSVTNTIVWAPSQWPTVCALARKVPKPYEVDILSHNDFEGWDGTSEKYFKGNLTGKISKIRTATFKKNKPTHIEVKYSMNVEAEPENIEVIGKSELMPKKIYKSRLPISKKKYSDLEKLCNNRTIPTIYVPEYKSLPYAANIQDTLADTDIEDILD